MKKKMSTLNHGDLTDYFRINNIFNFHRNIFPHIRKDYIERNLNEGNVIFEDNVVIIYKKYQKKTKLGNVYAFKDNYILHQIATTYRDGRASKIFKIFLNELDNKLYLTVRKNNHRAISFYLKNSMIQIGDISWKNNTIPGCVFLYNSIKNNHEKI